MACGGDVSAIGDGSNIHLRIKSREYVKPMRHNLGGFRRIPPYLDEVRVGRPHSFGEKSLAERLVLAQSQDSQPCDIRIAKLNFQLDDECDALEAIVTCGVDDDFEEIVVESTNSAKAAIPDFDEDAMIDEALDYMEG